MENNTETEVYEICKEFYDNEEFLKDENGDDAADEAGLPIVIGAIDPYTKEKISAESSEYKLLDTLCELYSENYTHLKENFTKSNENVQKCNENLQKCDNALQKCQQEMDEQQKLNTSCENVTVYDANKGYYIKDGYVDEFGGMFDMAGGYLDEFGGYYNENSYITKKGEIYPEDQIPDEIQRAPDRRKDFNITSRFKGALSDLHVNPDAFSGAPNTINTEKENNLNNEIYKLMGENQNDNIKKNMVNDIKIQGSSSKKNKFGNRPQINQQNQGNNPNKNQNQNAVGSKQVSFAVNNNPSQQQSINQPVVQTINYQQVPPEMSTNQLKSNVVGNTNTSKIQSEIGKILGPLAQQQNLINQPQVPPIPTFVQQPQKRVEPVIEPLRSSINFATQSQPIMTTVSNQQTRPQAAQTQPITYQTTAIPTNVAYHPSIQAKPVAQSLISQNLLNKNAQNSAPAPQPSRNLQPSSTAGGFLSQSVDLSEYNITKEEEENYYADPQKQIDAWRYKSPAVLDQIRRNLENNRNNWLRQKELEKKIREDILEGRELREPINRVKITDEEAMNYYANKKNQLLKWAEGEINEQYLSGVKKYLEDNKDAILQRLKNKYNFTINTPMPQSSDRGDPRLSAIFTRSMLENARNNSMDSGTMINSGLTGDVNMRKSGDVVPRQSNLAILESLQKADERRLGNVVITSQEHEEDDDITEEDCLIWSFNPLRNPKNGKKIREGSLTYRVLEEACKEYKINTIAEGVGIPQPPPPKRPLIDRLNPFKPEPIHCNKTYNISENLKSSEIESFSIKFRSWIFKAVIDFIPETKLSIPMCFSKLFGKIFEKNVKTIFKGNNSIISLIKPFCTDFEIVRKEVAITFGSFVEIAREENPEVSLRQVINSHIISSHEIPNFPILYHASICDHPKKIGKTNGTSVLNLLIEKFDGSIDEIIYGPNVSIALLSNLLMQTLLGLASAQHLLGFIHGNINSTNILYKKIQPGGYWEYIIRGRTYFVENLGFVAALNDFDKSSMVRPHLTIPNKRGIKIFGNRALEVKGEDTEPIQYGYYLSDSDEDYKYGKEGIVKGYNIYRCMPNDKKNLMADRDIDLNDLDRFPPSEFMYDNIDLIKTFIGGNSMRDPNYVHKSTRLVSKYQITNLINIGDNLLNIITIDGNAFIFSGEKLLRNLFSQNTRPDSSNKLLASYIII